MARTIIIIVVVVLLGYFAFNYSKNTVNNEEYINQDTEQIVDQDNGDVMDQDQHGGDTYSGGVATLVEYENRAMNYTIMRPDKWFWQHSIKSQIIGGDEKMLDVFATDPFVTPLPSAPENSRISIAVYSAQPDNFDELVSNLESSQVSIAEQSATRYEGIMGENQKVIIYAFTKGNYVFHLAYRKASSTPEEEGVFENLVSSLKFK